MNPNIDYEYFIYEYFKQLSDKEWDRKQIIENNITNTINANVLVFAFIGFYVLNFPDTFDSKDEFSFYKVFIYIFCFGVLFFVVNLFFLSKCTVFSKKYYKDSIKEMKKYIDKDFEEYIKNNNINYEDKKGILIKNLIDKYANRGELNSETNNFSAINNYKAKKFLFASFICLSFSFVFYFYAQGDKINTSKIEIKNVVNMKNGDK